MLMEWEGDTKPDSPASTSSKTHHAQTSKHTLSQYTTLGCNVCQEVSLTDLSLPLCLLSDGQPGRPTLQKKAGVTGARPALPLSKYVVLVST